MTPFRSAGHNWSYKYRIEAREDALESWDQELRLSCWGQNPVRSASVSNNCVYVPDEFNSAQLYIFRPNCFKARSMYYLNRKKAARVIHSLFTKYSNPRAAVIFHGELNFYWSIGVRNFVLESWGSVLIANRYVYAYHISIFLSLFCVWVDAIDA